MSIGTHASSEVFGINNGGLPFHKGDTEFYVWLGKRRLFEASGGKEEFHQKYKASIMAVKHSRLNSQHYCRNLYDHQLRK